MTRGPQTYPAFHFKKDEPEIKPARTPRGQGKVAQEKAAKAAAEQAAKAAAEQAAAEQAAAAEPETPKEE